MKINTEAVMSALIPAYELKGELAKLTKQAAFARLNEDLKLPLTLADFDDVISRGGLTFVAPPPPPLTTRADRIRVVAKALIAIFDHLQQPVPEQLKQVAHGLVPPEESAATGERRSRHRSRKPHRLSGLCTELADMKIGDQKILLLPDGVPPESFRGSAKRAMDRLYGAGSGNSSLKDLRGALVVNRVK